MKMRVLDISENNGCDIDFEAIAKVYYGVILRLGYGNRHLDDNFLYNYRKAKEAGLKIGIYYYSYALQREQGINEGKFTVEILRENDIKSSDLELGIWFDMEDADGYKERNGMPSNEEITAICSAYIVEMNKAGFWCGIYASLDWLENVIYTEQLADYVYYWVAQWDDDLDWDKNVFLWQYTATEYFNGKFYDCSFLMKR